MMTNFRTYQLAVSFYRLAEELTVPAHLKDQLLRASSSIVLNLAEGRGKRTTKDQCKFFQIAMGSLRECQAILDLARAPADVARVADQLGARLHRLIERAA